MQKESTFVNIKVFFKTIQGSDFHLKNGINVSFKNLNVFVILYLSKQCICQDLRNIDSFIPHPFRVEFLRISIAVTFIAVNNFDCNFEVGRGLPNLSYYCIVR